MHVQLLFNIMYWIILRSLQIYIKHIIIHTSQGQATDIQIHAEEILKMKKQINQLYVKHTKRDFKYVGKHKNFSLVHNIMGSFCKLHMFQFTLPYNMMQHRNINQFFWHVLLKLSLDIYIFPWYYIVLVNSMVYLQLDYEQILSL